MSKIGRKAISIPEGAAITPDHGTVSIKGPLGALAVEIPPFLEVTVKEAKIWLKPDGENLSPSARSLWGYFHRFLGNALLGVTAGFTRTLELQGVGYRAKKEGEAAILNLGFSHPVKITPPPGITLTLEGDTKIKVAGVDKQKVGEVAAKIRSVKPAEPYKSKGIKYSDEVIRKKAGKAGKVGAAFGAK